MSDANTRKATTSELSGEARRNFMRALLADLRALERMLAEGLFEQGVARIGAEQELFLVDKALHPAPLALKVLDKLQDSHYTTELALFNLEINADPQPFSEKGLSQMESQLTELYGRVRKAAQELGGESVLFGILPTLAKSDLDLKNMVPKQRYMTLNRAMNEARGEAYDFSIQGLDELIVKHETVMVESCNASFQVHLQVADPSRFHHFYNVAQLVMAPVLAVGTNSPVLFGRRLWAETRIALFEQACDIRTPGSYPRDRAARVSFGNEWAKGSVVDLFKENITRFRALVGTEREQDPNERLDRGEIPELNALRLHNGTIYRWNRPCYGISENGKPHLRIELRVLPSGPTIADEVANAAFWLGLMSELTHTIEDIPSRMDFEVARANFYAVAREGIVAPVTWLDGEEVQVHALVLDRLLPLAKAGLARAGVDAGDADRYLGIVEQRVKTLQTGSRWALRSLAGMKKEGTIGERHVALVTATLARQNEGRAVSEWDKGTFDDAGKRTSQRKVSHYMGTNLFTVQADDPVELVADLMGWEAIRYVLVEDHVGRLVGLVSSRGILRAMTTPSGPSLDAPFTKPSVADVMRREVVTVTPDTLTIEAIQLMQRHKIGCLPVLQDDRVVGIITEEHLLGIAIELDLVEKRGGAYGTVSTAEAALSEGKTRD